MGTTLTTMYGRYQNLVDAQRVFDKVPQKNVMTWTALISGMIAMTKLWNCLSRCCKEWSRTKLSWCDLDNKDIDKLSSCSLALAVLSHVKKIEGKEICLVTKVKYFLATWLYLRGENPQRTLASCVCVHKPPSILQAACQWELFTCWIRFTFKCHFVHGWIYQWPKRDCFDPLMSLSKNGNTLHWDPLVRTASALFAFLHNIRTWSSSMEELEVLWYWILKGCETEGQTEGVHL